MKITHVIAVAAIAAVTGAGAAYAVGAGRDARPAAAAAPAVEQQEDVELHWVGYRKWAVIDAYRGHTGMVFPGRADFYSDVREMLADDPENDGLCTLSNAVDRDPEGLLLFMESMTGDAPGTPDEQLTFAQAVVDHCAEGGL